METIDVIGIMKTVHAVALLDNNRFLVKYGNHKVVVIAVEDAQAVTELSALRAENMRLREAAQAAHDWLNRFGEHAPIAFGGEQELDDLLCAALASAAANPSR